MTKKAIVSSKVPQPAGAYSHAIAVGELLFVSGQGGFDPATGKLASDEIEGQTDQAFRNVDVLLEEAGLSRSDIVSCLVHLSDLSLFARYNAAYERQFADELRPVRTTVGASLLAGMLIELTVIAHRGAGA
jgi:2-iminobutanoate/2-iminopropanoate deaminase